MTAYGMGYCCKLDQGLDAELYTKILEDELCSTISYNFSERDFFFQHDNAPPHTSKQARDWLASHEYKVLDWPAMPLDLNPIEHLWHHLKMRLSSYKTMPRTIDILCKRIEKELNMVIPEVCRGGLIDSIPASVREVIK
jgi:hypothetical protein